MRKVFLFVVIIGIFTVRFISYERVHVSKIPEGLFNKKTTITGIITADPNHGLTNTTAPLTPLLAGEGNQTTNSKILIKIQNGTNISYGDKITVTGIIKHPENFMTDTDREFDYVNYLKAKDIYGVMNVSQVEIISRHHKSRFIENLFHIKKQFVHTIKILFPKNEAGLLAGIIIGEKSLLPKEVLSDFQITGLTHMLVLSGYNITIVTTVLVTLLAYLGFGYRARRVGAMIIIPVFIGMTGLGASSVRAGTMSMFVFLLQITTRPAHTMRIIFYTAGSMIFVNPRIALHDPGFHLSFLAFIGLMYATPIVDRYCNKNKSEFFLKKLIIETVSVQIFVMPYILWMSGAGSWLSLISNIITVPIIPFIMGFGFIAVVLGMIWYPLSLIIAIPLGIMLNYVLVVAKITAGIPWAQYRVPVINPWWIMVFYGTVSVFLIIYHRHVNFIKKTENEPNHSI